MEGKMNSDGNRTHLPELQPDRDQFQSPEFVQIAETENKITKDKQEYQKIYLQSREGHEFEVHQRDGKQYEVHQYPIQYICHKIDPET